MPCFHPLWAHYQDDARRPVKIIGHGEPLVKVGDKYDIPGFGLTKCWPLPCGQCIGCRLDYSRSWADRCVIESFDYPEELCWFVTLTYNDDHLSYNLAPAIFDDNPYVPTLVRKDLQDFLKRLRDHCDRDHNGEKIRFYAAGEYGSTTLRPHYHLLIYGLSIHDITPYKTNFAGDRLFMSNWIADIWGKGFVVIAPLSWRTAAYTARYVVKKLKGKDSEETYSALGMLPEFSAMSLKPGIGMTWMLEHFDEIYTEDLIHLPPIDGHAHACRPPRVLDDILKERFPDLYQSIKDKRSDVAIIRREAMLSNLTWLDEDEFLCLSETKAKNNANRRLKRLDI